jgi:TetR/AcrR family transcriptional regulator, repressor of fatR-cypB operon
LKGMKVKDERKIPLIYNATLDLVVENGIEGIKMCEVARAARLATGTIYIYFKNKEELINALFLECRKAAASCYFLGFHEDQDFKEGLRTIWVNLCKYKYKNLQETIFIEQCYHSHFITEDTREMIRQLFEPLYRLIERGKKEGIIKDMETFFLLNYVIGISNEMVKSTHYKGIQLTNEQIDLLFSLCWDGLRK